VLCLLHGVGDIEYSSELHGKASAIVDGLLEDGSIAPMVVVMPFGFESNEQKYRREISIQALV
jgi:hypothetical protein